MVRNYAIAIIGGLLLAATGCAKKVASPVPPRRASLQMVSATAGLPQRYIAESQNIEVISPESELQKSWESVIAFCGTIQCEVVSSKLTARMGDSVPSGSISLRVAPRDLEKLLDHIQKLGKIAEHTTEREDETAAVVDTDAKIKNLTSFRDNLRAMLAKPSATVKDLVEIQQQLTETQSQLDSVTAQRKVLANQTEKIAVVISFHVEGARGGAGSFAEIWDALRDSGSDLADSIAALITVTVTVVPWLVVIVPLVWLLAKAWRKLRKRKTATLPPPAATP